MISWFPVDPRGSLATILNDVTEPILAPLRRVVPRMGMVDLTPMIAMLVLFLVLNNIPAA